ncbi:MAG TPA: fumarylacetoacetate hydrolase family protein [Pirellulales bacterium]|nr:fumarylacetoacetate hydrolase family protein [Pirellulales bacterium]
MRFVTFEGAKGPRAAAVRDGQYVDLHAADPHLPTSLKEILAGGPAVMELVRHAARSGASVEADAVRLLAPIPDPQKVLCVGLNYVDHARESRMEPPSEPVYFCKLPTAVIAHEQPIVLPKVSEKVDYEAELVVVIGRGGRDIALERALDHVAGYCIGNDVSARDWQLQKPGGQWLLGKTFDTFAPTGPEMVTVDEVGDAGNLRIQLRLNGQTMQDSSTQQLIFSVPKLIAYVSQVCTLVPGDVIFTGTPPGVGSARKPPVFLKPGDVCEVEIEKLGVLRNRCVAAAS